MFFFYCFNEHILGNFWLLTQLHADTGGLAVKGVSLRPLEWWDRGFESNSVRGCSSLVFVCIVQGAVFATSWSVVRTIPAGCVCVCVCVCNYVWSKNLKRGGLRPIWALALLKNKSCCSMLVYKSKNSTLVIDIMFFINYSIFHSDAYFFSIVPHFMLSYYMLPWRKTPLSVRTVAWMLRAEIRQDIWSVFQGNVFL